MRRVLVVGDNENPRDTSKHDVVVRSDMTTDDRKAVDRTDVYFIVMGPSTERITLLPDDGIRYVVIDASPRLEALVKQTGIAIADVISSASVARRYGKRYVSMVITEYMLKRYPKREIIVTCMGKTTDEKTNGWKEEMRGRGVRFYETNEMTEEGEETCAETSEEKKTDECEAATEACEEAKDETQTPLSHDGTSVAEPAEGPMHADSGERMYVINLESRRDRWNQIQENLRQFEGVEAIRYAAQSGAQRMGWIYLAKTIFELIRKAQREQMPYIIILEDDNYMDRDEFRRSFTETMTWLRTNAREWDVFNGNPTNVWEQPRERIRLVDERLGLVTYEFGKTTNFVIYNRSAYDRILSMEGKYDELLRRVERGERVDYGANAYDAEFGRLGLRHITHLPYYSYQAPSFSDIENRYKDDRRNFELNMQKLAEYTGYRMENVIDYNHHVEATRQNQPTRTETMQRERVVQPNGMTSRASGRVYRVPTGTRRPRG